jgi:hypothetical protein
VDRKKRRRKGKKKRKDYQFGLTGHPVSSHNKYGTGAR